MSVPLPLDITPAEERCPPPLAMQSLPSGTADRLAPMFKALSDPIRLRLLSLIASTDEVCVCDLTDAFEVTGATISHHLRVLREADLVDSERRGTWVYYRIRKPTLDLLGGVLIGPAQKSGTAPAMNQAELISPDPDVIRLLADPLRAEIVRLLADGPACTSHLVADTGAKQPNVSGHLKLLREAGDSWRPNRADVSRTTASCRRPCGAPPCTWPISPRRRAPTPPPSGPAE